jgi:hypothetical protein
MKYARIVDNIVLETFIPPVGVDIYECFTPEIVSQFIECPEEVQQNWTYQDNNFSAPVEE